MGREERPGQGTGGTVRTTRSATAFPAAAVLAVLTIGAITTPAAAAARAAAPARTSPQATAFDSAVRTILALPYDAAYVPAGPDSAFPTGTVENDFPAQDYTSGSIPGSPDSPNFPPPFHEVVLTSPDGAKFFAWVAMHPGERPAVEVVPGFNTHSSRSVVRWAAMLSHNGYDVIAADQRDYSAEYTAGYGYPKDPQTFGWKESLDVVTAGRYLAAQPGVRSLGIVGFSEGGQNTVLAMAQAPGLYAAGLTFSGPATQDTQIYSTAVPKDCTTPACSYPVTDGLVAAVVPPYDDANVCTALSYAASEYHTTGFDILARESGFHVQTQIRVPLLNFYSADDSLVPAFEATMMAGYEAGAPLQKTVEIDHGEHAYFFDRWWQQAAILDYFKALLPGSATDKSVTTSPTVNQTPGGAPLGGQIVTLGHQTRASADAQMAPYVCTTARGDPGAG
jgi:dienelactone hydrolase